MKAAENESDRKVEVHLHVDGKVQALQEYDEYVDPKDSAICCFVPVDDGDKIKMISSFTGTTLNISQDVFIDGVHRKAICFNSKTVRGHKSPKKSFIDTFLYKTDEGIIDTHIIVSPLPNISMTQSDGPETIGTIELRIYVTRQLYITHSISGATNYIDYDKDVKSVVAKAASYKQIPPSFQLTFEKNCAPLESVKASNEQRKMTSSRPGNGPWAIFRFHYRSMEAIGEKEMTLTYSPSNKLPGETRILNLEPVPPLIEGTKPPKDDGDSSTRASSPMPPPTPTKGPRKESFLKTSSVPKIQHPMARAPKPLSTEKEHITSSTYCLDAETPRDVIQDHQARSSNPFTKSLTKESPVSMVDVVTSKGNAVGVSSTPTSNDDSSKASEAFKTSTIKKIADKPTKPIDTKSFKNPAKKPAQRDQSSANSTAVAAATEENANDSASNSALKTSNLTSNSMDVTNDDVVIDATQIKDIIHKVPEPSVSYTNELVVKPAPIPMTPTMVQEKHFMPIAPITSVKRPAKLISNATPDLKRTKVTSAPETSTIVLRSTPSSPSPRPMKIERRLADQRKLLAEMRKKRQEMARKQATIDEQMMPYKQRMAEELERLAKEIQEEESAYNEDEQHFTSSMEMLEEFKRAGGDS